MNELGTMGAMQEDKKLYICIILCDYSVDMCYVHGICVQQILLPVSSDATCILQAVTEL